MKSLGEIMEELGFSQDAPKSSQKALLNHMIKAAAETQNGKPQEESKLESTPKPEPKDSKKNQEQLCFDFGDTGPRTVSTLLIRLEKEICLFVSSQNLAYPTACNEIRREPSKAGFPKYSHAFQFGIVQE